MKKIIVTILFSLILIVGCNPKTNESINISIDSALIMANFEGINESVNDQFKNFSEDEQKNFLIAQNNFQIIYDKLNNKENEASNETLVEAALSLVESYEVIKEIIANNFDKFSKIDQMRLKDFDKRLSKIYTKIINAKDKADNGELGDSTQQYMDFLSLLLKTAIIVI